MKNIFLLLVLPLCQISFAQTNLVKNGGFEMEFTNWRGEWKGFDYTKTIALPAETKKHRIMQAMGFASRTLYADAVSVSFK